MIAIIRDVQIQSGQAVVIFDIPGSYAGLAYQVQGGDTADTIEANIKTLAAQEMNVAANQVILFGGPE